MREPPPLPRDQPGDPEDGLQPRDRHTSPRHAATGSREAAPLLLSSRPQRRPGRVSEPLASLDSPDLETS